VITMLTAKIACSVIRFICNAIAISLVADVL
jgi:hypothetical protein